MDDTVIMKLKDHLYVVSNAGCSEKITVHLLQKSKQFNVHLEFDTNALLALQGPESAKILERLTGDSLSGMDFMTGRSAKIDLVNCFLSRCGYTGEDGFEILVPTSEVERIAKDLLANSSVKLAGLGARDSLRLEAGMCLYGHDLNEKTTPVEASLSWLIGKSRKESGGFPGFAKIIDQLSKGPDVRRVGLIVQGAPARGETITYF